MGCCCLRLCSRLSADGGLLSGTEGELWITARIIAVGQRVPEGEFHPEDVRKHGYRDYAALNLLMIGSSCSKQTRIRNYVADFIETGIY